MKNKQKFVFKTKVYRFCSVRSSYAEHRKDGTSGQCGSAHDEGQVEAVDLVEDAAEEWSDHEADAKHRLHHRQHR